MSEERSATAKSSSDLRFLHRPDPPEWAGGPPPVRPDSFVPSSMDCASRGSFCRKKGIPKKHQVGCLEASIPGPSKGCERAERNMEIHSYRDVELLFGDHLEGAGTCFPSLVPFSLEVASAAPPMPLLR